MDDYKLYRVAENHRWMQLYGIICPDGQWLMSKGFLGMPILFATKQQADERCRELNLSITIDNNVDNALEG